MRTRKLRKPAGLDRLELGTAKPLRSAHAQVQGACTPTRSTITTPWSSPAFFRRPDGRIPMGEANGLSTLQLVSLGGPPRDREPVRLATPSLSLCDSFLRPSLPVTR
jgi:hypothetical protein